MMRPDVTAPVCHTVSRFGAFVSASETERVAARVAADPPAAFGGDLPPFAAFCPVLQALVTGSMGRRTCSYWYNGPSTRTRPTATRRHLGATRNLYPKTGIRLWRTPNSGRFRARTAAVPGLWACRGSTDLVDPGERVGEAAVLDADQLLAQAHSDRTGRAVADQPLGRLALDPAHRGDHRRGAAGEHLGQLARCALGLPLVDRDPVLDGLDAEFGGQPEQGVAGDAGQQGPGQRRGHDVRRAPAVGAADEKQVHAAHFFDPAMLGGVQPDHLVAALLHGLLLGHEGARVVPPALDRTGAAGRGPGVLLGQPHRDRLDPAAEVGRGGRGDDAEQVLTGRVVDAEVALGRDQERTQVQAVPLA